MSSDLLHLNDLSNTPLLRVDPLRVHELHGSELVLRPPQAEDTAALAFLTSSPCTSWWRAPRPTRHELFWVVQHDLDVAGVISVTDQPLIAELRLAVAADTSTDVMTAALSRALDHLFSNSGTVSVRWTATAGDLSSARVAHAVGFRFQPQLANQLADLDGGLHDAWTGSIGRDDPRTPATVWRWSTVETEHFRLRPLRPTDDHRIREALDDDASRTFLFDRPRPLTPAHAAAERISKWWQAALGLSCGWAVADKATDEYLGDISLMKIDPTTGAELGFYVHPEARGSGVLSEAIPAAMEQAWHPFELRRLTLFAAQSNHGSRKLAENMGFHWFGTQPLAALSGETYEDLLGYELLRPN